jgi:ferric-dicitrate binding protein FerR (iron transport regulator)
LGATLAWNIPLEAEAGSDAEIRVGAQDVLLVAAGSELRLTHDGKRVLAELPHGTVFSAVYPGTAFGVQAGRARVDAHGTLFVVHRGAGDRDYVCICQGRIRIRAPGLDRELAAANYGMKIGLNLRLGASNTVASEAKPEFYTEAEAIELTHALQKAAVAARASQGQ